MMHKLLKLIFNHWVVAGLGLTALGLIIWFVGPLIGIADYRPLESPIMRWIVIGVVIAFYIGRLAWRSLRSKLASARLMEGLMKQAPAQAASGDSTAQHEVETLRRRFDEAAEVLKEVRGKQTGWGRLTGLGRRQYLYELPWYIFIGAPGSGKTTALLNSGLQFPLAHRFGQESIRGIGGTRNCDWWFTDQAVLLDTAGRYTTQESNQETDSAAWAGFLQLLKKFRPRRPINGVIVTVSVSDLLQQNSVQLEMQANALRQRIQELHTQLNIRFPLYLLVTKADLLAGFMDFFSEFGREERAQIWGTTFPFAEPGTDMLAGYHAEYDALVQRLNDRLIDRLQQEHDPQRRTALYIFPQQFSSLQEVLSSFITKVMSPSRYEVAPMLRGVYFTSGTQEGSPIDRVLGSLSRAFHLEHKLIVPQHASGKSFFLMRLLQDVIFPEAGLAGTNLRWERRRALLEWSSFAVAMLLTVGAITAWTLSYKRNQSYVAAVEGRLQAVDEQVHEIRVDANSNVVELIPALQAVKQLATPTGTKAGETPLDMNFGLYQGEKLEAATSRAYYQLLRDAFIPRLAWHIEEQLYTRGQSNPDLLYEGLKAYLMLSEPAHFDPIALKAFITADWEVSLPREVSVEQRRALEKHLDAFLGQRLVSSPFMADKELVDRVRLSLARTPIAERIYQRIKRQGVGENLPEFTIAKAAGPSAALVFRRTSGQPLTTGVPGLFSFNGYHNAFLQASIQVTKQLAEEADWVLGSKTQQLSANDEARLFEDVRRLYLEDYAQTWESFINDISLVPATSLQQSIQQAGILSAADSPLPLLLRAIVKEVTLVNVDEADKTTVEKVTDQVGAARERLRKLLGPTDVRESTVSKVSRPEYIVDARFEDLRRLVSSPAPGQPAPIDATLSVVDELYTFLLATNTAVNSGNPPPASDVPIKLKADALRLPEPLRSMLTTLSLGGATQALGVTRVNLGQAISTEIGEFCNKAILGRYPFVKSSSRDVTQEDFARLFAPAGLLDGFFKQQLAQYVDTSTPQWHFRKVGDASMGDATGSLIQFQRAQTIREVFFRGGGSVPGLKLEFKPMEMDSSITQLILDVDGQLVRYSHGPQVPMSVQWPGPGGTTQVRLQILPSSPGDASGLVYEGPWALFRMLDRVLMESTPQAERYLVTFNINGRKAKFQMTTTSVQNPFRLRELEQFRCPGRL